MTKLIYIGGYGRSGSTLLECLLTASPEVVACGEIVCCLRERAERECTCGAPRQDCAVWGAFYGSAADKLRGWTHQALTLALLDQASSQYRLLVDSSKTAWGATGAPFRLRRKLGRDFHLLHVVRDPRGVSWSNAGGAWRKRAEKLPTSLRPISVALRHVRTALGWSVANLSCEIFARLYPVQYSRVRYEDFTAAPAETLGAVFGQVAPDAGWELAALNKRTNRHQLYGNKSRYRALSPATLHEDRRWKIELPARQRRLVSVLTWPLRTRYGY